MNHKLNKIILKLTNSGSNWGASLENFSMNDCCLSTFFDTFSRNSLSHFLNRTSLPPCDVRVCSRYPKLALDGRNATNNEDQQYPLVAHFRLSKAGYGLALLGRPPATTVVFLVRVTELPI